MHFGIRTATESRSISRKRFSVVDQHTSATASERPLSSPTVCSISARTPGILMVRIIVASLPATLGWRAHDFWACRPALGGAAALGCLWFFFGGHPQHMPTQTWAYPYSRAAPNRQRSSGTGHWRAGCRVTEGLIVFGLPRLPFR